MPRIEIVPAGWETSHEKEMGDGTPTIDVCKHCSLDFTEGEPVEESHPASVFEPGAVIGSTDVEHPPYQNGMGCIDEPYHCECCDEDLTEQDN